MKNTVNVEKYGFSSKNLKIGDEVAIFSFEECFDKWLEYDPDAEMHFVYATITGIWQKGDGLDILIEQEGKKCDISCPFDWLENVTVRTELF
tara:strand:- start:6770 stop:7045 length:276 start_codon:yes stop_codon:yes gene_type:complete